MGSGPSSTAGPVVLNTSLTGTVGHVNLTSYGLSTTEIPAVNPTSFPFDYEREDPRFFDPTEDSNEDYDWFLNKTQVIAEDPTEDSNEDYNWFLNKTDVSAETGTKVFGGEPANRAEIPHQVSLRNVRTGKTHFCGATIIHSIALLTAAHCMTDLNLEADDVLVFAGEHNLDMDEEGEQIRNVSRIIIHEGWNSTTFDNDIAILIMDRPLVFDNYTRPIDLAKGGEKRYDKAKLSGWGMTEETDRAVFNVHQVAEIRFVIWEHCRRFYSERSKPTNITENMLCAGGKKRDACQGDSGGPLTCKNVLDDKYYLCGIVSFGSNRCGSSVLPGVYTDVSKYNQWIRKYVRVSEQRYQKPRKPRIQLPRTSRIEAMGDPWPANRMQRAQASLGEFPYQVSVQVHLNGSFSFRHIEGTVIHPLLIVTVAHDADRYKAEQLEVVTGMQNLLAEEGAEQSRNVRQVIKHEKFDDRTWDNNIALLVLEEPLRFDDYTQPIQILDENTDRKQGVLLSGWELDERRRRQPTKLQRVTTNLVDRQDCTSQWEGHYNITDNMLCAEVGPPSRYYCPGSGDPMVCEKSPSRDRFLCGISAKGVHCDTRTGRRVGKPDVYTDVSKYHKWITSHMQTLWEQYKLSILGGRIEKPEDCGSGRFRCPNDGSCIPEYFRCDGEYDCDPLVGWDENNCTQAITA